MVRFVSIPKEKHSLLNEDAILAFPSGLAVSDGAGGGGLFADLWSNYLVSNIPNHPILTWDELDNWLSAIWENFYNSCEIKAKSMGGLALEKFYEEGSFATLAAVWFDDKTHCCHWMAYGDSVVFHYRAIKNTLEYSIASLESFNESPHLINCKDVPNKDGLTTGVFKLHRDSIVFVCSDALSHYVLLMYYIENKHKYNEIIKRCTNSHTRNSTIVKTALYSQCDTFKNILFKLISSSKNRANLRRHLSSLERKGLLSSDDYSFGYIIL